MEAACAKSSKQNEFGVFENREKASVAQEGAGAILDELGD